MGPSRHRPTGESGRARRACNPTAKQWTFALAFLLSARPDFDKRTREAARAAGYRKPFRNSHRAHRSRGVQEAIRRYHEAFRRAAKGEVHESVPIDSRAVAWIDERFGPSGRKGTGTDGPRKNGG